MEWHEKKNKTVAELEEALITEEQENIFETLESSQQSTPAAGKVLVAELTALALVLCIFAGTYYWRHNPVRIVEQYIYGVQQEEWGRVYDTLSFSDETNPFLTRKMFVSAQSLGSGKSGIVRVKINRIDNRIPKGAAEGVLEVSYSRNNEQLVKSVPVVKRGGNWKVNGDREYVRTNVTMDVPKDSVVALNNIILDKSMKKAVKGELDIYEIPKVFDGTHYIKVEKGDMEKHEDFIRFSEEETLHVAMGYRREVLEKAGQQAITDMTKIYRDAAAANTNGRELVRLKLSGNRITSQIYDRESGLIEVKVESLYEYRYREKRWFLSRERTKTGTCGSTLVYSYNGERFRLEQKQVNMAFL